MIVVRTLCAGCGRAIDEQEAFVKEGVPYCCESCADTGACERGCNSDIHAEEPQTPTASDPARALTERLMEEVCQPDNLNQAYRRVKANKGAPGVDGMTVGDLLPWIVAHRQELVRSLLDGSYAPQPVRGRPW